MTSTVREMPAGSTTPVGIPSVPHTATLVEHRQVAAVTVTTGPPRRKQ